MLLYIEVLSAADSHWHWITFWLQLIKHVPMWP